MSAGEGMRPVAPTVCIEVGTLHVLRAQTLTVYVAGVQVELRVTPEGEPEIYMRPEHKKLVRSFEDWEGM